MHLVCSLPSGPTWVKPYILHFSFNGNIAFRSNSNYKNIDNVANMKWFDMEKCLHQLFSQATTINDE